VFRSLEKPLENRCKRITGVEGDFISHRLNLDGVFKDIHYSGLVPKGHIFVEGDNKNDSRDSRHYGPVPYSMLRGRVFAKVGFLQSLCAFIIFSYLFRFGQRLRSSGSQSGIIPICDKHFFFQVLSEHYFL
jgi:hypothetical protein